MAETEDLRALNRADGAGGNPYIKAPFARPYMATTEPYGYRTRLPRRTPAPYSFPKLTTS